ncbi:MAG: class I SAM-dependent methyltransferase [Alphaproteobacteria bacterium]
MSDELEGKYEAFYRERNPDHVYPVEFVVRAFLGNYPRLSNRPLSYAGACALDLGFGDGRNMPLLANLGMTVHGVEITEDICARAAERLRRLGISVENRVGRNCRIPFADGFFDHVLACHSCYYVDAGKHFSDNVSEIARVMKRGGRFVFSAPMGSSFIMQGARDLGEGHMEIANDPYGLRNGCVLKKFDTEAEIEAALSSHFTDFRIGSCRNDFWGIEEHVWIGVCCRR